MRGSRFNWLATVALTAFLMLTLYLGMNAVRGKLVDVVKGAGPWNWSIVGVVCALTIVVLLGSSVITVWLSGRWKTHRQTKMWEVAPYMMAALLFVGASALFAYELHVGSGLSPTGNHFPILGPPAILMGAAFATLGWAVQHRNSKRLQVRSHTFQTIQSFRNSAVFKWHELNIHRSFAPSAKIAASDLDKLRQDRDGKENYRFASEGGAESIPVLSSIYFVLNFNESMALAMHEHDLEEDMLREFYGGIVFHTYRKFIHIILDDSFGPDGGSKVWEQFRWLIHKWNGEGDWNPKIWHDIPGAKSLTDLNQERAAANLPMISVSA